MSRDKRPLEDEAEQVDRAMNEHMYRHSISNSYAGMSCDASCRTEALRFAMERAGLVPSEARDAD